MEDHHSESTAVTQLGSATMIDTAPVPSVAMPTASPVSTLTVPVVSPVVLSAPSMPAPRTQAPQRPRRIPAVDPSTLIPARRSSTRSIKRKKFDDELVESSLVKTERGGRHGKAGPTVPAGTAGVHSTVASAGDIPVIGESSPVLMSTDIIGGSGDVATSTTNATVTITSVLASSSGGLSVHGPANTHDGHIGTESIGKPMEISPAPPKPTPKLPVKPPPEKRSKPSSGKSASSSKGGGSVGGGIKVTRQVTPSKGGGSKAPGTRAVSKSKSRVNARSKSKRSRKQKTVTPAVKDLGRWKPQDDLALITAVQQTNDLSAVHTGVKFSCRFTLKEIEERWYALLYDPAISKIAMEAARQLHSDTVANIQGKALYSNAEEKLLGTIGSSSQPVLETFQNLLQQHPDVFHPARTPKSLHTHWQLMKQYHLLPDQSVQPMPKGDHILNLSDIEDFLNDDDIGEGQDETVEKEMAQVDRRNKREIRHLEQELPKWQVLVDSVTGISMPDFDNQTLGVLRGRLVRYLMRSREISLGRNTKDNHVDVDLSLEGPAWKISRRQGVIKLRNSGDFFIANEGKRPIIVDGKPVMCGNKQKLNNNSVVEISCLRFTFLINQDVINTVRADVTKPSVSNTSAAATT